nr:MAG TPA: hypothetical protein [Caudoviricetes sp.]
MWITYWGSSMTALSAIHRSPVSHYQCKFCSVTSIGD